MGEHHRTGPDGAEGVRAAGAHDVRRGAVHRLEHGRVSPAGIDVRRPGHAQSADDRCTEVAQDVAEEVRADDDVEGVGRRHEACGKRVDVVLRELELGMARDDLGAHLVPERHPIGPRVRLRRACQAPSGPGLGEPTRVLDHPLDPATREDARLHRHFAVVTLVHASSDVCVLPLGVLAHTHDVHFLRGGDRAEGSGPGEELDGAEVHVLVEGLPDRHDARPRSSRRRVSPGTRSRRGRSRRTRQAARGRRSASCDRFQGSSARTRGDGRT